MIQGGYTCSEGGSQLIKRHARIQDEDIKLRKMADLKARLAELKTRERGDLFDPNGDVKHTSLAGGPGGMLLPPGVTMLLCSRRQSADLD